LRPRLIEPRSSTRDGRTWLTYSQLDQDNILHGIIVFREAALGQAYKAWVEEASAFVRAEAGRSAVEEVIIPRQVHGRDVRVIRAGGRVPASSACDGIVTDRRGLAIGVSVADCIPLLAVGPEGQLGVAHCGWRGIASGIVEELTRSLGAIGSAAARTTYVIGAGIGRCCYEVGDDLLGEFPPGEVARFSEKRGGRTFFDLKQVVAARLVAQGVRPSKISIDKTCTACQTYSLSSFRREGAACGRMLAFLARTG